MHGVQVPPSPTGVALEGVVLVNHKLTARMVASPPLGALMLGVLPRSTPHQIVFTVNGSTFLRRRVRAPGFRIYEFLWVWRSFKGFMV